MALAAGKGAIDAELEARVPFRLRQGGYIPYVDHNVPPDVSWPNFLHYRQRLGELIHTSARAQGADGAGEG